MRPSESSPLSFHTDSAISWRAIAFVSLLACAPCLAEPWPQYRGPRHDGSASVTRPIAPWSNRGPQILWKTDTPDGFSSFTIAEGLAFTLITRNFDDIAHETCIALDINTGKEQWAVPLNFAKYDGGGNSGTRNNSGGDGPRSTPAIHNNNVYILDSNLTLHCLKARTGKRLWQVNLKSQYNAQPITWQSAASPLISNGLIYLMGGGEGAALIALHADTGELAWKAHDDAMTHATPIPATLHGVRQIIFFTQSGLVAVVPETGRELWRQSYPYRTSTAASPVVYEDIVYCSAGYGVGGAAYQITKVGDTFQPRELWRTPNRTMSHWSTPVCKDGYIYGLFGFKEYGQAPLKCIDIRTGKEQWSQDGFGPGNCILAGDQLITLSDAGEIILIEARPDAYKELARADVLDGKCWSTPALSDGVLYIRSTTQGAALRLQSTGRLPR